MTSFIASGKTRWACTVCPFNTAKKSRMTRHVIAKHTNIRFSCHFCPREFSQENERKVHYQTAHDLVMSAPEIRALDKNVKDAVGHS